MSGYSGSSNSNSWNNSSNNSQFGQSVWDGQSGALQNLYGQMRGLFDQTNAGMRKNMKGAKAQNNFVQNAANPAWQQQMQGGAYQNIDANKLQDQIYSSMQGPTATQEINNMVMGGKGNNYADAMKAQYVQDANIASQNMLNNLDARASASGLPGSSRSAITQGVGLQGINQNLQRNLAETGFNTFDKDLDRKLAIAGQADQANLARQGMLSDMLAGKQGAMQGGLGNAQNMAGLGMNNVNMWNSPWQAAGMYGNIIGRPTVLGSGSSIGNSAGFSAGSGQTSGGGVCFITTAATNSLGEPDDGPTLTKLRMFRDEFMLNDPVLIKEVARYYSTAPSIVEKINARPDSSEVYKHLNDEYLQPAVTAIDDGDNEKAYEIYKGMVEYCLDLVGE